MSDDITLHPLKVQIQYGLDAFDVDGVFEALTELAHLGLLPDDLDVAALRSQLDDLGWDGLREALENWGLFKEEPRHKSEIGEGFLKK